jgi:hypothetical protein
MLHVLMDIPSFPLPSITFSSEIRIRHEYSHWKDDSEENNLELLEFGEL